MTPPRSGGLAKAIAAGVRAASAIAAAAGDCTELSQRVMRDDAFEFVPVEIRTAVAAELVSSAAGMTAAAETLDVAFDKLEAAVPVYDAGPPALKAEVAKTAISELEPIVLSMRPALQRYRKLERRIAGAEGLSSERRAALSLLFSWVRTAVAALDQLSAALLAMTGSWRSERAAALREWRRQLQPDCPDVPVLALDRAWWSAVHGSRAPPDRPRPDIDPPRGRR